MRTTLMRTFLAAIHILAIPKGVVLWCLADHDLGHRNGRDFAFLAGEDRLAGTLWQPEGTPHGTVLLVHGDGPQDRTSGDGYPSLVNALLDAGLVVASWDKPGVCALHEDWLDESIADRTEEVSAAARELSDIGAPRPPGALGISQVEWVLPKLEREDVDFVGAAVSWERLGRCYGPQRRVRGDVRC